MILWKLYLVVVVEDYVSFSFNLIYQKFSNYSLLDFGDCFSYPARTHYAIGL